MSGGSLHGGVHGWACSKCRELTEGQLLPSWITFGVSTSGGGLTQLTSVVMNSFEAGVETPSAGVLHFSVAWINGVSGWSKHLLVDAALSENLSTLRFLIVVVCLFGVSKHCALETVLLIWHGWFPASDTAVDAVDFFVRILFGWWEWSLDLVWNDNGGNLHTLVFLDSWVQLWRMLVAERHLLLPRLTGGAAATELSNCGLT